MIPVDGFLRKADEILREDPEYQLGRDGSDGKCDCIGLIIGAVRRAGGRWDGIHGSNWTARFGVRSLQRISGAGGLQPGDIVFKARKPDETGYSLPERYSRGGSGYNGDLRDYYHVGIVAGIHPLRIIHMTSPRAKTDSVIGKWAYHGRLKAVEDPEEPGKDEKHMTGKIVLPAGAGGNSVNLREGPGKNHGIITALPVGSSLSILKDDGMWCKVQQDGRTGWMMSNYLEYDGQFGESNDPALSTEKQEQILAALKDIEKLIGTIRSAVGG